MRSTSNRLLRMKQASASSILQAVSRACGPAAREREDQGAMRREDKGGKEGGAAMLLLKGAGQKEQGKK